MEARSDGTVCQQRSEHKIQPLIVEASIAVKNDSQLKNDRIDCFPSTYSLRKPIIARLLNSLLRKILVFV